VQGGGLVKTEEHSEQAELKKADCGSRQVYEVVKKNLFLVVYHG